MENGDNRVLKGECIHHLEDIPITIVCLGPLVVELGVIFEGNLVLGVGRCHDGQERKWCDNGEHPMKGL